MLDLNNYVATSVSWPQLYYVKPGLKTAKNAGKKYFPNRFLPENEKRRLSRAFDDLASPCSRIEPQKEREKLSLVYAQGSVSRKSRKHFGPEKTFVKLLTACFGKPIFKHVFKLTKRNTSVEFDDSNPLRSWNTKGIVTPESGP